MLRLLILPFIILVLAPLRAVGESPLVDLAVWEKYRGTVKHPALGIGPEEIARARENIRRHEWARAYLRELEREVARCLKGLSPKFLEHLIPETTPLSTLFTPCPACRDQKKPYLPHGSWNWNLERPDELVCKVCKTKYPNTAYPESVKLHATWGRPQTFTYYGGEPFPVFSWKAGRPSFSGNIRAQKCLFMLRLVRRTAEAYVLTGRAEYAAACRDILRRFAGVYPGYLVHVAYGEVADMDPREAAASMQRLPEAELTYPPNKPDHVLHTRFWTAGRLSPSGIEGYFIRQFAEAYDLTCSAAGEDGKPVYSKGDRLMIERDLLLEGCVLPLADTLLNNKSVANRAAVGMVGAVVGHPELVRFGLKGFQETVDDWFLPDGGTPESPSYGLMAIAGVRDLSLAFRDYSDPPEYIDATGQRYDSLNLFRDSSYPRVWEGFMKCLQGDLSFPPFADSRVGVRFLPQDAEILAAVYPERPEFAALLREVIGEDSKRMDKATALYFRPPNLAADSSAPLILEDNCLPDLRIGFMRTGEHGRESLLLLNASHWGVHHHLDSLNLYYWKDGHELLTDLGYLWDHPDEERTFRTLAHNLVLIDEANQEKRNRGGEVHFFRVGDRVKAMRASSKAYPAARTYSRTVALVDHGNGDSYAIDFFDVEGGKTQDFVYHGPGPVAETNGIELSTAPMSLYDLSDVRQGDSDSLWQVRWKLGENFEFAAWNLPQSGERAFIGDGWGQRDSNNRDRGVLIPYIVRRCEGKEARCFISLYEGSQPEKSFVRNVRRAELQDNNAAGGVAVVVQTARGRDYVVSSPAGAGNGLVLRDGNIAVPDGELRVLSLSDTGSSWTFVASR